jgi:cell volume regulation protein A
MSDLGHFGLLVLLVSAALLVAVTSNRLAAALRVPAPALFLAGAAVAGRVVPGLGSLPLVSVQRIVTVALVVILFDGGLTIGWRRFRTAAGAIVWLGVAGTVVTAGALAAVAHLLGFEWHAALLLGTALAPTDPAVVFSVLRGREIAGRSGTLLEGESGANDPVGIALLASLLGASGSGLAAAGSTLGTFVLQMSVGAAVGIAIGFLERTLALRLPPPIPALRPLRALGFAGVVYGGATLLHGSGFLAVFLAGIVIGDVDQPPAADVVRALATLGEIVVFTLLGLTISVPHVATAAVLVPGVVLAVLMMVLVRPLLVGIVLLPVRLTRAERCFVLWAGLKGAVPIVLGIFLLLQGVAQAQRLYAIIFVVVLISVVAQGSTVPLVAQAMHIPMRRYGPDHQTDRHGAGDRGPSRPARVSGTRTGSDPSAGDAPDPRPRITRQAWAASPPPWITRATSRARRCLCRIRPASAAWHKPRCHDAKD